jgi:predicted transcriptional regulator
MQTNEKVIQAFADAKQVKSLALFHKLKKLYSHSIVHDYNTDKLAYQVGLNPKTVKKYVDNMVKFGIAEIRNGDLHLKKIAPDNHLCTIKFKATDTINHIEALLYGKLLHEIKARQKYQIKRKRLNKRIIEEPHGKADMKKRRKLLLQNPVQPEPFDYRISVESLTRKLNISKGKLRQVIGVLVKEGLLVTMRRVVKLGNATWDMFKRGRAFLLHDFGYCWFWKGRVYLNLTNSYYFPSHYQKV